MAMEDGARLAVVVMAAGQGKRMNDPTKAKVMFPIGGRPMIERVVDRALELEPERVVVVIGHNRESVRAHLDERYAGRIEYAEQLQQLGTGHAVLQAMPQLAGFEGDVLVLSGDVPLLRGGTIRRLVEHHRASAAVATLLSVREPNPTGYGRIVRAPHGEVDRIVEERDATAEERAIDEVNSGIYLFRRVDLAEALGHLSNDNAQGEYYLTDVFGWFRRNGRPIAAFASDDPHEVRGINTLDQLAEAEQARLTRD